MKYGILFAHISSLSALIPIGVGLFRMRSLSRTGRFLLALVLISGLSDLASLLLLLAGHTTWPLFNVYYLVQFILLYLIFLAVRRRLLDILSLLFILLAVVNFIWVQRPFVFNTYTSYVGGSLLIVYAWVYLYGVMRYTPVERIQDLPMMWISFGVLTYFGGNIFLFLFNNLLLKFEPGHHQMIWILHNFFNLLKNLLFAVALWKNFRERAY